MLTCPTCNNKINSKKIQNLSRWKNFECSCGSILKRTNKSNYLFLFPLSFSMIIMKILCEVLSPFIALIIIYPIAMLLVRLWDERNTELELVNK